MFRVVFPCDDRGDFRCVFLTTQTRGQLFVPGTNPLWGPHSWFVDGVYPGNLPLVITWWWGGFEGESEKKREKGSWTNLKGDGQLSTKSGNGEQMCGMVTGLGYAGVVVICSDQPVRDRWVVFAFLTRWKEDFVSMINRNFMSLLMMGVFSRVCSGV
jgi:hypothetical protein